jgi:hypothetical protein
MPRHDVGPDQPVLPDPILTELDTDDMVTRRCRGRTTKRKRCERTAPPWWPANQPWWCRTHDSHRP